LRLREGRDLDPALLAETRFALAQAHWTAGERRRAATLASMASVAYAERRGIAPRWACCRR
jgi:hypothetical protein